MPIFGVTNNARMPIIRVENARMPECQSLKWQMLEDVLRPVVDYWISELDYLGLVNLGTSINWGINWWVRIAVD